MAKNQQLHGANMDEPSESNNNRKSPDPTFSFWAKAQMSIDCIKNLNIIWINPDSTPEAIWYLKSYTHLEKKHKRIINLNEQINIFAHAILCIISFS